jgi:pimeloyl-ACP methyl ester carboxylesterase
MSKLKKIILFSIVLTIVYLLGPKWPVPVLNNEALSIATLNIQNIEQYVYEKEAAVKNMKPNNEAEIIWANDSRKIKTKYCFVYLPGFGASKAEGEPIHREIAKRYSMNLYLARLEKQGIIEKEPFLDLKENKLVESAKEAVLIGKTLGEKVIIVSTSTGGTLAFYLAAKDPDIASIIAYSPNVELADPMSNLLTGPWGLQLSRTFLWSNYRGFEANDTIKKWWINEYRIEGLITLKSLLIHTMTDDIFKAITQPVYMSYYYKNEVKKDQIISIPRVKETFELLETPAHKKRLVALPNVSGHCMASGFYSNEDELDVVRKETFDFIETVLNLAAVSQ